MFYIYANGSLIYHLANPELYLYQPKLTLEMGKAGSLEFGIMPDHAYYDRLSQLTTIVTVDYDDTEIFRGRVLSNKRDFQNMRQVYCEGNLSYLVDTVQKFKKYNGTVHALFREIINNHNTRIKDESKKFTVGNITVENRSVKLTGQDDNPNEGKIDYKQIALNSIVDEWNTTYDLIQTCIIDYVGGYLTTRHQNGVTYIDLLAAPSNTDVNTTTQEIELGVNMLDLEEEVSAEDLFTVLIPLGDDNLTIKSVNNGSDELVDTNAVNQYGRIIKTHVFNNVNEASTLLENARRYLESNINIPTTLTINALDKHIVNKEYDPIHLCDKVHIRSTRHNIVEYLTCTKIEYDLENPANDTYTFGNPTQTMTQRYREDKRKESDTYGNSGYGGGAGAAADAAEAAADAGEESVDEKLDKFYESWIDLDPSDGNISLGAIYKNTQKFVNVLSKWGIDAMATDTSSAINLNTFYKQYTDLGEVVSAHSTRIEQVSSNSMSQISLVAERVGDLGNVVDGNSESIAALILTVDGDGKSIAQLEADVVDIDGVVKKLAADLVDADKISARISKLETVTVNGTLSVKGGLRVLHGITLGDNDAVYSYKHYHSLAEKNGKIELGYATETGPTSFNIADTKFYKDGVSAAIQSVTIASIDKNGALDYSQDYKRYNVPVIATASNGQTGTATLTVGATAAYNHGVGSVTISSLGATWTNYKITVTAKASNEASKSEEWDAEWIYNEGVNSFEAVSVSVLGSSKTRYTSGGSVSVTKQGESVPFDLWREMPPGSGSFTRVGQTLYYGGSRSSYNVLGSSETVYDSGGTKTYYKKKKT